MAACNNCGRYTGPASACPYCGTTLDSSLSVRNLKLGSLVLAVIGLVILLVSVGKNSVPYFSIGDLNPAMNFAYIRVAGTVSRQPNYDADGATLNFWLDDGTGELLVGVYRQATLALIDRYRVPRLGDRVELEGTLRLREDYSAITINLPQKMVINRPDPEIVKIGFLDQEWAGRIVQVEGAVRNVWQPYSGLTLVALRDETGTIDIAASEEIVQFGGLIPYQDFKPGVFLQIEGMVTLYRGDPQITLTHPEDVAVLAGGAAFAPRLTVTRIGIEDAGRFACVSGVITGVDAFSAGTRLALDDGSGTIDVVIWRDLKSDLKFESGMLVEVTGEIAFYQGEPEIIPEITTDVRVTGWIETESVTPAPAFKTISPTFSPTIAPTVVLVLTRTITLAPAYGSATLTPTCETDPIITPTTSIPMPPIFITPLGQIDESNVGKPCTVRARVASAVSIPFGFKFFLDDGSGQIVLLLWTDAYAAVSDRYGLRPGAEVQASGRVGVYQGELQIEPEPDGILILEAGWGPPAEMVETGRVGEFIGQAVQVQGQIVSRESFGEDNLRLIVDDGSGAVQVILWRDIRALTPDAWVVGGSTVRVTGDVSEYRSAIQLAPALPVYILPGK